MSVENVEAKVLEKLRKVLTDNADIKKYVKDRVYDSHISSIAQPKYPAISLTLLPGMATTEVPEMINLSIQIDLWFEATTHTWGQVLDCYQKVRQLLHRQNLTDNTIGVTIGQIFESAIGPQMFERDTHLYHLPARYAVVAI